MEQLKNLPIGIQDFESLILDNYLYVDKTAIMYQLVSTGRYYFLSRPRRFGKSLFLTTLKAYFLGKKDLFKGMAVENLEKNWTEYPILHLDLNSREYKDESSLISELNRHLESWEKLYGNEYSDRSVEERFLHVIDKAYAKTGQRVVILVDEYDKPMLQAIGNEKLQDAFRSKLKAFYSVLKTSDAKIRFAFLTGVTRFSKVSIFSDLNNLNDISLEDDYSSICGISEDELHKVFNHHVERLAEYKKMTVDETYAELKKRYDGYHFSKNSCGMYNPFSVLNALYKKDFGSYWFETGTPTFLVKLLKEHDYNLERMANEELDADSLNAIDTIDSNPVPIIFQSGYLTIKSFDQRFMMYRLGFPNEEVKEGFVKYLMPYYTSVKNGKTAFQIMNFVRELESGRIDDFMARLKSFFADTPYELVRDLENHYQNVMYIVSTLCGLYTKAEYHTSVGRIDMTIETADYVYIFEFKFEKSAEEALRQIEEKHYAEPFAASGKKIFCIGANFNSDIRNIDGYEVMEWLNG